MKKNTSLKIGVGTPTILMIFVVLCMVILSILSLQEANFNQELAKKEKTYLINYYEADTKGKQIVSSLKQEGLEATETKYQLDIQTLDPDYQFILEIDETKQLNVQLDGTFNIKSWIVEKR